MEHEARRAQEQMVRTASDYTAMIKKKDTDLPRLMSDLEGLVDEEDVRNSRVSLTSRLLNLTPRELNVSVMPTFTRSCKRSWTSCVI